MGFLLVPLFVSAVFFLAVCLRDFRGDFSQRTHQFEDLDEWRSPPQEIRVVGGVEVAAPRRPRAGEFLEWNLVRWLALLASISVVLSAALTWPYLLTFLFVCGLILSLVFRRIVAVGLVAVTALMMVLALGWHAMQTERHWSEPRLTLIVIPFSALGDDPLPRSAANTLNEALKRELASWDGLDFIPVKTAAMAQQRMVDADQRGGRRPPRYALEGSVLRSNEALSIHARLFDARSARDVWSAQLSADPADQSKILAELTSGVASALDNELAQKP